MTMPDRWQLIEQLCEEAFDRRPEERAPFLAGACGGDDALRLEVESLLEAEREAGGFIETPALIDAGVIHPAVIHPAVIDHAEIEDAGAGMDAALEGGSSLAGRHVGPYRLVREIGRGGMGSVWLAARDDEQFQKRVAVKLLAAGLPASEALRRFREERQILACLEHPHIARLLDAGRSNEGLHYIVMEYVEGVSITDYCVARALSVRERVTLLRTICSTVHFAHQLLVVHRDLKPANILVTDDGEPKLLDFGIAKVLTSIGPLWASSTVPLLRLVTPAYASPEQLHGAPATTSSDVYSLGVLCYELLTGRHPHRFTEEAAESSFEDIFQAVCERDPERPSVAAARDARNPAQARSVAAALAGDLDAIILKAMRKAPRERYASAEDLANDFGRHLAGLPVSARQGTLQYRAQKFAARHRAGVAVATTLVVLLFAFAATMAVQARRIAQQRDRALTAERRSAQEAELAQQVSTFLLDLFKVSDPSEARGNRITAREILDKGSAQIARELKGQAAVQARLMNTMGLVYQHLGLYRQARPLLADALAIRRRTLGEEHPEVAESMHNLGELKFVTGDLTEAEQLLRGALAIRHKTLGDESFETTDSQNVLAMTIRWRETPDANAEAERLYRAALATRRKLFGREHPAIAQNLVNLAMFLTSNKRDYAGAEPLFREALDMNRRLLGNEHPEVPITLNNLAMLLRDSGRLAEAEPLFREALEIDRRLLGDEHRNVSIILNNLANLVQRRGDFAGAASLYREALALTRKAFPDPEARWEVATIKSLLGACLIAERRFAEAQPLLLESYPIIRATFGDAHPRTQVALKRLVDLYDAWGKSAKGAQYRAMLAR